MDWREDYAGQQTGPGSCSDKVGGAAAKGTPKEDNWVGWQVATISPVSHEAMAP